VVGCNTKFIRVLVKDYGEQNKFCDIDVSIEIVWISNFIYTLPNFSKNAMNPLARIIMRSTRVSLVDKPFMATIMMGVVYLFSNLLQLDYI